ncbi:MAG: DUF6488 family protein [Candidatus Polarisedimenticolaceae bacterium]|nr:DUF6488 family protein [Candidatus Polarisedimenticolaceae bacterium]
MRIQAIIISLALSFFSLVSMAGTGHDHGHSQPPITQNQAEERATKNVSQLIERGKVDKSWESIKATKSEKKKFGGNMEWVVTFNNASISDSSKQTLYVFLSLGGKYLGTNHTGN